MVFFFLFLISFFYKVFNASKQKIKKKNPNLLFNVVLLFIYLYMHAYIVDKVFK
jgi:hypothetical protein